MSGKIADLSVEEFKALLVETLVESERVREMIRELALESADIAIEDWEGSKSEAFRRSVDEAREDIRAGRFYTHEEMVARLRARSRETESASMEESPAEALTSV